jgi:putative membrane protein
LTKDKNITRERRLAPETQNEITRMTLLTGPEFDREFANMMVSDHQQTVQMFREASKTARNPDLKAYVDGMLPKLQKHLQKGQELQSRLFNAP